MATIQAAGAGLPAIASRIYGLSDAVKENVTGVFHAPGAVEEIGNAMTRLYLDKEFRFSLAKAAELRAHTEFAQSIIVDEMVEYIRRMDF